MPTFKTLINHIHDNTKPIQYFPAWFTHAENMLIIKALEKNTTVKKLEISNRLGIESDDYFYLLADVMAKNKGIHDLFITDIKEREFLYLLEKLSENTGLENLTLNLTEQGVELTEQKAKLVEKLLINNSHLLWLEIHINNPTYVISTRALEGICDGLASSKLKTLSLHHANLSKTGLELLATLFCNSKTLSNVVLCDCNLEDVDLIFFAEKMKHINKKKILVLQKNPVTKVGLEALAKTIIQNQKLYVHYTKKNDNGSLMRFETEYVSPYIQRNAEKELKKFLNMR